MELMLLVYHAYNGRIAWQHHRLTLEFMTLAVW